MIENVADTATTDQIQERSRTNLKIVNTKK